jgi:methionine-rich copper-binding protein CopC
MTPRLARALVALAAVVLPQIAQAHALLLRTSPPRRAVLQDPPKQIQLWFNERLEPAYATITLFNGTGATVSTARATAAAEDRRRVTLDVPPLPSGRYTVRFRVLSVDGHVVEDSFPFSVR